jgi:hypothetical protein
VPPVPDYFSMALGGITQPPSRPPPASHLLGTSLLDSLDKLRGVVPPVPPQEAGPAAAGGGLHQQPQDPSVSQLPEGGVPPAGPGQKGRESWHEERRGSRAWRATLRQAQAGLPWLFNTQAVRSGVSQELREDYAVAVSEGVRQ